MISQRNQRKQEILQLIAEYLEALVNKTPEVLPVSPRLRVTFNGEPAMLGENDAWKDTLRIPERQSFADPDTGEGVFYGVLTNVVNVKPTHTTADLNYTIWQLYFLRLKVEHGLITEVEEFVKPTPNFNYIPFQKVKLPDLMFDMVLPEEERRSREELIQIVEMYWDGVEKRMDPEIIPFHPDAHRFEYGMQVSSSEKSPGSLKNNCKVPTFYWTVPQNERRYPVVDVSRGLVVSIAVLKQVEGGHRGLIVAEYFRIESGLMRRMCAFCRIFQEKSGWAG